MRGGDAGQSSAAHTDKGSTRGVERAIKLGTRKILVDSLPEVHQYPATLTDLHFKLNKMHSKMTVSHDDPENLQPDSSRKRVREH